MTATKSWNSARQEEAALSRHLRNRWAPGSFYVLDVDWVLCHPSLDTGLIIEAKHLGSRHPRHARVVRHLARKAGWWSGLFVYDTAPSIPRCNVAGCRSEIDGDVTRIDATLWPPDGRPLEVPGMAPEWFDDFAVRELGARCR